MVRTFAVAVCVALALTTAAWAQERMTGRVQHVEPGTRIIHFADGRIVHLSDRAVITVNGREVAFEQVRPGMTVVLDSRAAVVPGPAVVTAPGATVVTAPGATVGTNDAWAGHPPVDASGVVASVDSTNGIITFQDGRTVRMTSGTRVWNQGRTATVRPGDRVFLTGAQPWGYQVTPAPGVAVSAPAVAAPAAGTRQYMGTVVSVDSDKAQILLNDGRIVKVNPTTRMTWGDRVMTLRQLRPGDQLVVTVAEPVPAAVVPAPGVVVSTDSPSALPRPGANLVLDAIDIKIMREHEAP